MAISIKNLNKDYNGHSVFEGFSIDFKDNVIKCILGESGCGKTTLLNIISGLEDFGGGNITGVDNNTFSYIFQEPRLLEWYNVRRNMEYVLEGSGISGWHGRIEKYLKITGLHDYSEFYPQQLSGGMKQRLSIARAFAYPGDILLMDEPFKALDMKLKKELTAEFLKLWDEDRRTVLFVTHELDEALMMADNIHILGGNPLRELYVTDIKAPKGQRRGTDEEIVLKRKILYSVFTGQDEED
ncbi:MAG: ABC transporter ATP-binding protein [Clostridia bacterium]|nr:ABC transporter ATP-binding protein [Clostridia bacterium]